MNQARQPVLLVILLVLSLAVSGALFWKVRSHTATPAKPAAPPRELLPYAALGSNLAENNRLADLKWNEAQFQAFLDGIRASYEGRGYPFDDDAKELHNQISARVGQMLTAEKPDPAEEYFKQLREKENVSRTASGLHYRITLDGEGAPPRPTDTVVVSYAARTPDGTTLQQLAGGRVRVGVTDLLPGLAEGVQLLKPGGKALIFVPANLSFGEGQWPQDVPPGMPIGFFVELHEVIAAEPR
jgi:FKBP-type peptidyl-prolyl cis-trans isomerase FkpA/FKBP-type peptidyl-prolyl cis-trans isomerase FklB